jgi:hypothetical protein
LLIDYTESQPLPQGDKRQFAVLSGIMPEPTRRLGVAALLTG